MYYAYLSEDDRKNILTWWNWLQKNRGACAELRRTETPADIFLTDGFHQLYTKMSGSFLTREENLPGLAAAAGIMSFIEQNTEVQSFAALCASGTEKPVVSELRFASLQKSRTLEELYTRMRRIIQQLKGNANVLSVTDDIFHWYLEIILGKEESDTRNHILVHWGMEYFQHEPEQKKSNRA